MHLRSISGYARELKPLLPPGSFAPAPLRLLWLPVHAAVIAVSISLLAGGVAWPLRPLLSLPIGASFAGLTFLAHEALHGAVVRGRATRRLIGWLGFLPFAVSPRLWEAWHNREHHNHTNDPSRDPDAYPTLEQYRQSVGVRASTELALGRKRLRGLVSLLIGFSVQSTHQLLDARSRRMLSPREHLKALFESALAAALSVALAFAVGPAVFVFAFVLPLILANSVIMSMILTNHSLSPHTNENDPLVNSLTVTGPRWFELVTLGFGFHVEHHLFPAMSGRHAARLSQLLKARFPDRYQAVPLPKALRALYRSPRVYDTPTTLVDPQTGERWQTLTPKPA